MTSWNRRVPTRLRHDRSSETTQRCARLGRVVAVSWGLVTLAALVAVVATACGSTIAAPPDPSPPSGGAAPPALDASGLAAKVAEAVWNTRSRSTAPSAAASASSGRTWTEGAVPAVQIAPFGVTWACSYAAVGAASGSTFEVRIDDLQGRITPEAGQVVALVCARDDTVVHQETFPFDPALPLGSLDR